MSSHSIKVSDFLYTRYIGSLLISKAIFQKLEMPLKTWTKYYRSFKLFKFGRCQKEWREFLKKIANVPFKFFINDVRSLKPVFH
jgi:predicted solute-binding protein